jgi:hypothetical protein
MSRQFILGQISAYLSAAYILHGLGMTEVSDVLQGRADKLTRSLRHPDEEDGEEEVFTASEMRHLRHLLKDEPD